MKTLLRLTFVAALLVSSMSTAGAQDRRYKFVNVDVPFKFNVGMKSFRPGQYQLLFVGTNLMAMKDTRARIVASLVTRNLETAAPAAATKVIFRHEKKHFYLAQINFQDDSRVLEILGEEVAIAPPAAPASVPPTFTFGDRREAPHLKQ